VHRADISGGIDSYYEYLLKAWLLFDDKDCKKMWETSIKAVNKYLADNTRTGLWYSQVDMNTGKQLSTHYGALDAFFPAVLAVVHLIATEAHSPSSGDAV
jgi:mannose/cellobiose epimerase-like protein (N-acyl-D-glucosamine 2-epimerase family)